MTLKISRSGTGPSLTKEQIDSYLRESMGGYSAEELRAAFKQVQDAEHWKNPIDAIISREMIPILERAIPFITGTDATFIDTDDAMKARVVAAGYWAGPCN